MISARRDLDDRVARRQDRQAAMLVRAQVRAAGALRAPGRALGRCGAIYAKPSHPAPDVTPAASGVLRLLPCGFGRAPGAPFATRAAVGGGRTASAALASCTPRGILFPLAFTPRLAAGFAHRAAFHGLLLCATRAQASLPPCPVAPLAPVTRAPAAPFGISAGVKYAGCPGLRAPCALGLAPLLAATLAQAVIRHGPGLSASWTHAAGEAFGGNAFITPPPARTFFIGVFVWHVPPFRGRNPGEGRPARLRRLRPAEHLRGQAA